MSCLGAVTLIWAEATDSLFKEALRAGSYPWYDPTADRVRPVWPVRYSFLESLGKRLRPVFRWLEELLRKLDFGRVSGGSRAGNSIATILLLAAVLSFLFCIYMLWLRRRVEPGGAPFRAPSPGRASGLTELPDNLWPEDSDPWAEANRRRTAGDLAGATVCLFAHQLLSLDQMGLIRLTPGRTGRHYVGSLEDRELKSAVAATLLLFEEVYYGQRAPRAQDFERVWKRAEWFQQRRSAVRSGVAR